MDAGIELFFDLFSFFQMLLDHLGDIAGFDLTVPSFFGGVICADADSRSGATLSLTIARLDRIAGNLGILKRL